VAKHRRDVTEAEIEQAREQVRRDDINLDQAFTTAAMAMSYALDNWDAYCQYASELAGVEHGGMSNFTFTKYLLAVLMMADPSRMPQ
jgi:hypothetical protein